MIVILIVVVGGEWEGSVKGTGMSDKGLGSRRHEAHSCPVCLRPLNKNMDTVKTVIIAQC